MSKKSDKLKLGDKVLLTEDREGVIRFIGEVHFANGLWYGIELLEGTAGTNDGSVDGQRYFSANLERGIFVTRAKIRRKLREKDLKSSSRQRRQASLEMRMKNENLQNTDDNNNSNIKLDEFTTPPVSPPVSLPLNSDQVDFLNEKIATPKSTSSNSNKDFEITTPRKPGPRDIGRIDHFEEPKWEKIDQGHGFLEDRVDYQTSKQRTSNADKQSRKVSKAGPREIGRIDNFQAPDYEVNDNSGFLEERLTSPKIRTSSVSSVKKKAGPREIGKIDNYKPPEYEVNEAHGFLEERISGPRSRSSTPSRSRRKDGPREIGRISDWSPPDYEVNDTSGFLQERLSSPKTPKTRERSKSPVEKKPGPREIGRISDWKPPEWEDTNNSDGFLKERISTGKSGKYNFFDTSNDNTPQHSRRTTRTSRISEISSASSGYGKPRTLNNRSSIRKNEYEGDGFDLDEAESDDNNSKQLNDRVVYDDIDTKLEYESDNKNTPTGKKDIKEIKRLNFEKIREIVGIWKVNYDNDQTGKYIITNDGKVTLEPEGMHGWNGGGMAEWDEENKIYDIMGAKTTETYVHAVVIRKNKLHLEFYDKKFSLDPIDGTAIRI